MSFDSNVNVNVVLSALAVSAQGFTVPLFVAAEAGMGAGFTERIRFYTSQQAVTDDATDLGTQAVAALTSMFAQTLTPNRVACGRADLLGPETYAEALDLIKAENDAWFGFAIESRADADIGSAGAWALTNKRLYVPQSASADVILAPETDAFGLLKGLGNEYAACLYHALDAEYADCAWLANRLSVDPDLYTTIWSYVTLISITKNSLSDTELTNLLAKNANVADDFFDESSTGDGTVADGTKIDLIITREWVGARVAEKIATHLLTTSNAGRKIPYTDHGINTFRQKTMEVLNQGVIAEHFIEGGVAVQVPKLADISSANKIARTLPFTFTAEAAGAIEKLTITGHVTVGV